MSAHLSQHEQVRETVKLMQAAGYQFAAGQNIARTPEELEYVKAMERLDKDLDLQNGITGNVKQNDQKIGSKLDDPKGASGKILGNGSCNKCDNSANGTLQITEEKQQDEDDDDTYEDNDPYYNTFAFQVCSDDTDFELQIRRDGIKFRDSDEAGAYYLKLYKAKKRAARRGL